MEGADLLISLFSQRLCPLLRELNLEYLSFH